MISQVLEDGTATENDKIELYRHSSLIIVRNTPKGRGVFAKEKIASGIVIETCPVLMFPFKDLELLKSTLVDQYSYNWPIKDKATGKTLITQAISLGLGSIFNHSKEQNVGFQRDLDREVIVYRTLKDIQAGDELCISYGSHLWFKDSDGEHHESTQVEEDKSLLEAIQLDLP